MGSAQPLTGARRAAVAAALVCAALLPGAACAAWDATAWRVHCSRADVAAGAGWLRRSAESLRHNDPEAARQRACAVLDRDPLAVDAALDLAEALLAMPRGEAADTLLRALDAHPRLDPAGAARQHIVWAELDHEARRDTAAAEHADRALALLDRRDRSNATLTVRALLARAAITRSVGKGDAVAQATAVLAEAERLLVANGLTRSYQMGEWLNQQTMLAYARSDLDATIALARREVELVVALDGADAPGQLDALATLGAVLGMQRRNQEAADALEEARRIGRATPSATRSSAYLGIVENLSALLIDMGRPKEALDASQEAVALANATWGKGSPLTLTPLNRRSMALETLQRYAEARTDHAEMLALLDREGVKPPVDTQLRLLDFIAGFYIRLNDLDEAQATVRRSQAVLADTTDLDYWRGRLARRQAQIADARGQWATADRLLAQSSALLTPTYGAGHIYIVNNDVRRCDAEVKGRLATPACDAVAAGLARLRGGTPAERADARRSLAAFALANGQPEQALAHQVQAVAAAQSDSGQALLWSALDGLAGQMRSAGNRELAVVLAKSAVVEIEAVRRRLRVDADLRQGWLQDKYGVYRRLADWLAEDGRIDEALQVQRLLKNEEFRDFVRGRSDADPAAPPVDLAWTPQELAWLRTSPLSAPLAAGGRPGDDPARAADDEAARARAWQQAIRGWPAAAPRPAPDAVPPKPAAGSAPNALRATLFPGPGHLNIVMDGDRWRHVVRVPTDTRALARDIGRLLSALEGRDDARTLLRSLYLRVAAPIDNESRRRGVTRWTLRLDGDLRYLPFGALHDGRSHLVERYTIVQQAQAAAPATDALRSGGNGKPAALQPPWLQAFGSTQAANGMPPLQAVADEICGIVDGPLEGGARHAGCNAADRRRAVPGRGWLDAAFTRERLRAAAASGRLDRANLLHIGTHFVLRPGEVGRSWMQLGDGTRLHLHDMLDWQLGSQELVTLSACQTGAGGGSEVEGLAALMLSRGAGAVIASLWQVDDRSTSALMRALYGALRGGADPADALRQAQIEILRSPDVQRRQPFRWAAFFLSTRGG